MAPRSAPAIAALTAATLLLGGCTVFDQVDDFIGGGGGGGASSAAGAGTAGMAGMATDAAVTPESFRAIAVTGGSDTGTAVSDRVARLREDLRDLQATMISLTGEVNAVRAQTRANTRIYHGTTSAIVSRFQVGTTAGNPELVAQWNQAQAELDGIAAGVDTMSGLAAQVAANAGNAAFLLDGIQATLALSGAVEEDHRQLRVLQDETLQTDILIERLAGELRGDIARQSAYVANERASLATLAAAIDAGQLLEPAASAPGRMAAAARPVGAGTSAGLAAGPPLVTIRFDRPGVNYEPALYTALTQALEVRPSARFEVVAVSPVGSTPERVRLAQSESRRNADAVVRSMSEMGLPADRISVSATTRADVADNEVRIYVR